MKAELISKIDSYIESAKNAKDISQYLLGFSEIIAQCYPEVNFDKSNLVKSILSKELPNDCQRFISFCLLRIFSINRILIENDVYLKIQIFALFDNNLKDIYTSLGINEKTNTYNKESKLSDYIKVREREINDNLNFDQDIQVISNYEGYFKKTINYSLNRPLFKYFINLDSYQISFDKLFKELKQYINNNTLDKYIIYNQAHRTLEALIIEFKNIGTKYSIIYFVLQFEKIRDSLDKDFKNSPFSKAADLEVIQTEKRYPFSVLNVKNKFELKILNSSKGTAFKTTLNINDFNSKDIDIQVPSQYIGTIEKSSVNIEFEYSVKNPTDNLLIDGELAWFSFDDTQITKQFLIELKSQDPNVDWNALEIATPYDLEPVETEQKLIGRDTILHQLRIRTKDKIQSSYIYGQRRVGKTSIVKTLQSTENRPDSLLIIYLEAGDWNDAQSPFNSMENLGKKICDKIKSSNHKFNQIRTPSFHGSFNRLTDFLDDLSDIDPNFKVLIILDEFDRISKDLQKRGDIGQSFMLTLRAISNRQNFGFILVGGEKLEYILSQWQEFNKFKPVRVDYFDKEKDWDDFKKLIKSPIENNLEISDKAIDYIYNQTSGNPYFTKLICIELYSHMVKNHDRHVTEKEAIEATEIARDSSNIGATDFSHFWEDGIKEKADKENEVSLNRRKILICISELIKLNEPSTKERILLSAIDKGLSEDTSKRILEEFEQRKIIKFTNNKYTFISEC
jgi:hypothetical protein